MLEKEKSEEYLKSLQERTKELNCLYKIEEIMSHPETNLDEVCRSIIKAIPSGWQYPHVCQARIILDDKTYAAPDFRETNWVQNAEITIQNENIGTLSVFYSQEMPPADYGPFLHEEAKLITTIAERLGYYVMYRRMKSVYSDWKSASQEISKQHKREWQVALDLLKQTDKTLYLNISHKILNYLCWSGIAEAENLRQYCGASRGPEEDELERDSNQPHQKRALTISSEIIDRIFKIASERLSDQEIMSRIHKWIQEDKLSYLVQVINRNLSLSEVADAIRRYYHFETDGVVLHSYSRRGIQVNLIRRFLSDQLPFINIAKHYIEIGDFYDLLQKVIYSAESHGKLGGKSAGLYLAAQILRRSPEYAHLVGNIKIPLTWHVTSDMLLHFMHYNNFDEVFEHKYKDRNQIRFEYPHIVQTFKNSHFPPEIVKGLSAALDDFENKPLIVRSSSLLEDRVGAAFSGKYKSLFLANQGSKRERLDALMDAIAEVYASTFSPDPIEYRSERGLLDFGEEMGIMIQEVVGKRVGNYFLPAFAGVAFSNNEFRWSARISRKDGLLRLVPGLGTRAVDRISDDYPVLIAPGQPNLRVNPTVEEVLRYAPKKVDVINLETNSFETIEIKTLLRNFGADFPGLNRIVSISKDDTLRKPMGKNIDFENDELVVTFEGLISDTPFVKQIQIMLKLLEENLETPVDIEFASDGKDFYLLQCRSQSYSVESKPSIIPRDIPSERKVFSANRYISNGRVPDITHIVYIDPQRYGEVTERGELLEIGHAVGKLNKLLPKRQFILMGPGRWGSRGDIKLGVNVTYSDINNTAVLIEIARKKGNYVPDLSFGTHFFQDLVEANIRYLPLYPDDKGIVFNDKFLLESPNILADVLPGFASLKETIHLIDVPRCTDGQILKILMNADQDEAVGILMPPTSEADTAYSVQPSTDKQPANYWRWRMVMAELVASRLDPVRFGVKAIYLLGSTKNATAGPTSDIDLLIHFVGTPQQREQLEIWMEGWNLSIDEMNYQRTGFRVGKILDVQIATDRDIADKTDYAVQKIGAITDAAKPLRMMQTT